MNTTAEQRAWWRQNAGAPLALLDDFDAALALLRRLEWFPAGLTESAQDLVTQLCPCCGNWKTVGHAADCELARLLKAAPREEGT